MALSFEEFQQRLVDSGLVDAAEVQSAASTLPRDGSSKDAERLARLLIDQKKLTSYQAQEIYAGRGAALTLGNYVVQKKLGQGGMGVVLQAHHRRMKRLVAIKVLSKALTEDAAAIQRFQREAEAVAKLNHPNIVVAYDADESGGMHFLVMEYVAGSDLSALVKKSGPLPISQAVDYILQTACGLEYAHQHGVIHRDIKPANLLLDESGTVKILDMGLARIQVDDVDGATQAALTGTGAIMGTIDYMSPEQAVDTRSAGPQADIYSLGASLYYLVTGKPLIVGETVGKKLQALMTGRGLPTSMKEHRDSVPDELDEIFRRMTAHDPAGRYTSMTEVIAALEAMAHIATGSSTMGGASTGSSQLGDGRTESFLAQTDRTAAAAATALMQADAGTAPETLNALSAERTQMVQTVTRNVRQILQEPKGRNLTVAIGGMMLLAGLGLWAMSRRGTDDDLSAASHRTATSTVDRAATGVATGSNRERPPLAIAPFDAAQAKAHQEAWANYLGRQVVETNSLGMELVLIPPGEFLMGAPDSDADASPSEKPQHRVRLTQPLLVGRTEVTQGQYRAVMGTNPRGFSSTGNGKLKVAFQATGNLPVESVSWNDAQEFCRKLSAREGKTYRLLTEAEWEYACRAGTRTKYHCGDDEPQLESCAWYGASSQSRTQPVATKHPNAFGLHDMHGNVWEWCLDWYDSAYYGSLGDGVATDPVGPQSGSDRVNRGGGWVNAPKYWGSAYRNRSTPDLRSINVGFRVAQVLSRSPNEAAKRWVIRFAPPLFDAGVSRTAAEAKAAQQAWAKHLRQNVVEKNDLDMELILIPPGEFLMGSGDSDAEADSNERPQHRVRLKQPLRVGKTEVTQSEYRTVMGTNPSYFSSTGDGKSKVGSQATDNYPVETVSWNDAQEFCRKLSAREGKTYRLLTEAEWEYACRAGTMTKYHFGDDESQLAAYAWYYATSEGCTQPVATEPPNAFGLHDLHGNVYEWCLDWYDSAYYGSLGDVVATAPTGPSAGSVRVLRGGSWGSTAGYCRSAYRRGNSPEFRDSYLGFRVAQVLSGK